MITKEKAKQLEEKHGFPHMLDFVFFCKRSQNNLPQCNKQCKRCEMLSKPQS